MIRGALAVAATLVLGGVVPALADAPRADTVVPHDYGIAAYQPDALLGDSYGMVVTPLTTDPPNTRQSYTATVEYADGNAPFAVTGEPVSLVGTQLVTHEGQDSYDFYDVATDVLSTVDAPGLVAGTGDGWLGETPAGDVTLHHGSTVTDLGGTALSVGPLRAADSAGALFAYPRDGSGGLAYVDYASKSWSTVTSVPSTAGYEGTVGTLTPTSVVWSLANYGTGATLYSAPRAAKVPAATKSQPIDIPPTHLVANGEALAWDAVPASTNPALCQETVGFTSESAIGGMPGVVNGGAGCGTDLVAYASGFATNRGDTQSDAGLYAADPGQSGPGTRVVAGAALPPAYLDATEGHLGVTGPNDNPSSGAPEDDESTYRAVTTDGGQPRLGAVAAGDLGTQLTAPIADSGDLRARIVADFADESCDVDVTRNGTTVFRPHFAAECARVTLSGNLLAEVSDDTGPGFSGPPVTTVEDIDTGAVVATVPGWGVVEGRRLAWVDQNRSLFVRDLQTGHETQQAITGVPADAEALGLSLQLHGDWLGWLGPAANGQDSALSLIQLGTDGSRVASSYISPVSSVTGFALADGLVLYSPPYAPGGSGDSVELRTLATGVDDTVTLDAPLQQLALTDTFAAYFDDFDDTVHVAQVTETPDAGPRLLGLVPANTVLQAGQVFAPTFQASRGLTYALEVAGPNGIPFYSSGGTSTDGSMPAAQWSGTIGGVEVEPGTYTWTLYGTGLTDALGQAVPLSGTITIEAPGVATVHAPARVSDAGATSNIPVSWSSPFGTTYDVAVSTGIVTTKGKVSWSKPAPWLTGTTRTSATWTHTLVPGSQLRFVVTPHANGATGPTGTAQVAVPVNDRSSALTFSAHWSIPGSAEDYLGTVHRSAAKGASLTWQTGGDRIQVIGTRCSGCGTLAVYVDGKLKAHVSAAGRAANRAVLGTVTLSRKPGKHTVVLVATSAKPVGIDAVVQNF